MRSSSGNCPIALKSQLLIITAVGYYKLVKSIHVTADACTTPPRTLNIENERWRFGFFSVPYRILTSEKLRGNWISICLLLSGLGSLHGISSEIVGR
jgi:hypothetical protein